MRKRGTTLSGKPIPHGTVGGYTNHQCRCKRCRKAWAEAAKDRRRRMRERNGG